MSTLQTRPHPLRQISSQRFFLLGRPGGYLTCLPAGDARMEDLYRHWTVLAKINRPLTPLLAEAAKAWAIRTFDC